MLAKNIEIDITSFSEKNVSVSIHVDKCILFHDIPEKEYTRKEKNRNHTISNKGFIQCFRLLPPSGDRVEQHHPQGRSVCFSVCAAL